MSLRLRGRDRTAPASDRASQLAALSGQLGPTHSLPVHLEVDRLPGAFLVKERARDMGGTKSGFANLMQRHVRV